MPPVLNPKQKQYSQKFRSEWTKEKQFAQWLAPAAGNEAEALCRFCSKTMAAKLDTLKKHQKSDLHQKHERDRGLSAQTARMMAEYVRGKESDAVRKRKEAELRMAAFVAEHSSFSASPHFAAIISKLCDVSPKLGRVKASMLIKNVLAPTYREKLIAEVKGKPFSIIIDEATDVSVSKTLGLIIRYADLETGVVHDTFYRLLPISKGDANTIVTTITSQLVEDGLDLSWMVGIGIDGANVMVGRNHSVTTLFTQLVPHLMAVRCVAHSLAKVRIVRFRFKAQKINTVKYHAFLQISRAIYMYK